MDNNIIFFDGECLLCNKSVIFIARNDSYNKFRFASLQSDLFQKLIREDDKCDSIILYSKSKCLTKSDAVLSIISKLRFPINLFIIFYLTPKFIRDNIYDYIARRRHRYFKRINYCSLIQGSEHNMILKNKFIS